MDSEALLNEIGAYCRRVGIAESTFGRLAVNDGKLVRRLRFGGRVTVETTERVRTYMQKTDTKVAAATASHAATAAAPGAATGETAFRFYDNRQKYLLFVTTCTEKQVVAKRVSQELPNLHPRPPGLRIFDAGIGDGTVLASVLRSAHAQFPTTPFYVVGKEISVEDVRIALAKMADRFSEHPATVLVITNMLYAEAPWLTPSSVNAASSMVWHEVSLLGSTAAEFEEQISTLNSFLAESWRTRTTATGGSVYEKPVALVIYRDDYKFMLDQLRPRRGATRADYDLVIASQPYRLRASAEFKAKRVLGPLARSLAPGGRMIGIHSHGDDPASEIIAAVWPGEKPFLHDRHILLQQTKTELGSNGRDLNFSAASDARALFRYEMASQPGEVSDTIGTSTLMAAWNAAVYVAQIDDQRLAEVMAKGTYLDATGEVLKKHGGLWFWDESFVITRKRES